MSCGYAEVIKYGMIKDRELFELLESENNVPVSEIVRRCVKIKADVVEGDEFDNGARKLLNFGHTLGHAVEKHSNFVLTHGEAVAGRHGYDMPHFGKNGRKQRAVYRQTLQAP